MQAISPQQKNELLISYLNLQRRSLEFALKQLKNNIELIQKQIMTNEDQLKDVETQIHAISPQKINEQQLAWLELQKRSYAFVIKQLKIDIELIQKQITSKESQLQGITDRIQEIHSHL